MNQKQGPTVTRAESANRSVFTNEIPARVAKLPGAIARLMTGPPMSERERFQRNLLEARTRSDWLRPR